MITKKQFIEDVRAEVVALRENATKGERLRLDIERLDGEGKSDCIYGQMTGNCFSARADQLLNQCAIRIVEGANEAVCFEGNTFGNIKKNINGTNRNHFTNRCTGVYFSALEAYICLKDAKNKNVIAFLREEKDDLVL